MVRDLSNRDNGLVNRPPASESYSSMYANPPMSADNSRNGSPAPPSSDHATGQLTADASNLSLSVNYLPSKFSSSIHVGGGGEATRRRPVVTRDSGDFLGVPKMGGGVDAFRSGEARMGGEGDGDDDDDNGDDGGREVKRWFVRGRREQPGINHNKKLRWNKFKWILFSSNVIVNLLPRLILFSKKTGAHRWFFFFYS